MEEKKETKKTKQNPINPGLIILILIIAGLGFLYFKQGQLPKTNPNQINQTQPSSKQTNQNKTGVIESIKDAITKNISFKCQYQPEGGNQIITMYFKGGKIRSEYSSGSKTENIAIVDNNRVWNWQPKEKKGVVFSIDLFKGKTTPDNQSYDKETIIKQAEKYRQNCRVENLSDSLFVPPADIKFQDMDEMMKGMMEE
jgi:hypothetical protein